MSSSTHLLSFNGVSQDFSFLPGWELMDPDPAPGPLLLLFLFSARTEERRGSFFGKRDKEFAFRCKMPHLPVLFSLLFPLLYFSLRLSVFALEGTVCAPAAHSRRPIRRNAGQQFGNFARVAAGYAGQRTGP